MKEVEWVGFAGWSGENFLGFELEGRVYGGRMRRMQEKSREERGKERCRGGGRDRGEEEKMFGKITKMPLLSIVFFFGSKLFNIYRHWSNLYPEF